MRWQIFSSTALPKLPSNGEVSSSKSAQSTVNRWNAVLQDEERYQSQNYPTSEDLPGCMSLMDDFLMCYALVPQLRNLYRHGESRDCRWKWHDFKFCLSLKSESEEARRELWIKRRAEGWAARRVEGSSEDVWDRRKVPLENFPAMYPEEIGVDEVVK